MRRRDALFGLGKLGGDVAKRTATWAKELEGRTGITKLNSRQVFSGMPPITGLSEGDVDAVIAFIRGAQRDEWGGDTPP